MWFSLCCRNPKLTDEVEGYNMSVSLQKTDMRFEVVQEIPYE